MAESLLKAAAGLASIAYLDAKYGIASDVKLGRASTRATINHKLRTWKNKISMYDGFLEQVNKRPNDQAYFYEGHAWTWKQVEQDALRVAQYLLDLGLKPGDRIALLSGNSVAFVTIWLACMSLNVAPAFINHGLTGQGLVHCIKVSKGQAVLYEPSLEANVAAIQSELKDTNVRQFVCIDDGIKLSTGEKTGGPSGSIPDAKALSIKALAASNPSPKPIDASYRKDVTEKTPACLIYTSGTTGLPKAALCSHGRIGTAPVVWSTLNKFTPQDRIYTPMPLYHSSAAFICIAAAWYSGSTVIIGRKFSASRYWTEVRNNDATVVQYIGEIARYLLAVPPSDLDKAHRVRMAYGNGMRPDVWSKFRDRFNVKEISEFYASSEGNGALLNYNTGPFGAGAIGRFGPLARTLRAEFKIVKVDSITEDIYRDPKTGLCVQCQPEESGEFLMKIDSSKPSGDFQGYADNPSATQKKILADVFVKGDKWFRSGDLMKMDSDGFYWFQDRLGDTFRWRGENVSTAEVAGALGQIIGEANVYGVEVPGSDGRAGCAAIPSNIIFDPQVLAAHVKKTLPKYAVPFFLRIVPTMEQTGTVKHLKVALRQQGIHHDKVQGDALWWLPPNAQEYRPFTPLDLQELQAGRVKL
ncbi:unnamed protein product [Sympodiomycopsis kandeliae]